LSVNKIIIVYGAEQKEVRLPRYGELKIVCHDGKIKTVETTTREKVD